MEIRVLLIGNGFDVESQGRTNNASIFSIDFENDGGFSGII